MRAPNCTVQPQGGLRLIHFSVPLIREKLSGLERRSLSCTLTSGPRGKRLRVRPSRSNGEDYTWGGLSGGAGAASVSCIALVLGRELCAASKQVGHHESVDFVVVLAGFREEGEGALPIIQRGRQADALTKGRFQIMGAETAIIIGNISS